MTNLRIILCCFILLVLGIGSEHDYPWPTPPPWRSDGIQDGNYFALIQSAAWFKEHPPGRAFQARYDSVWGIIPVEASLARKLHVTSDTGKKYAQNCMYIVFDFRHILPEGEISERKSILSCPDGWLCKTEMLPTRRLWDHQDPTTPPQRRRNPYCIDPNGGDHRKKRLVHAHSHACIESSRVDASISRVAARVLDELDSPRPNKKARILEFDLNEPALEATMLADMEAKSPVTATNESRDQSHMVLTLKSHTPRTVDPSEHTVSMSAISGHKYKACFENDEDRDLTIQFMVGVKRNEALE